MELAIEMDQHAPRDGYGKVHKAGCRDLRDAEPIGAAESLADIPRLVEDATGWEADESDEYRIAHRAPCVQLPRGGVS